MATPDDPPIVVDVNEVLSLPVACALVFVWAGLEFTRFAWNRTSELADLPLWLIHVAWPVAGFTWIAFAGEQIVDEARILFGRAP